MISSLALVCRQGENQNHISADTSFSFFLSLGLVFKGIKYSHVITKKANKQTKIRQRKKKQQQQQKRYKDMLNPLEHSSGLYKLKQKRTVGFLETNRSVCIPSICPQQDHYHRTPSLWQMSPVDPASASRAEDPGFVSRLRRDCFGVESYQ